MNEMLNYTVSEEMEKVKKEMNEEMEKVKKEMTENLKKTVIYGMEEVKKEMNEKLEEMRYYLEGLEDTNSVLYIKERESNDEIYEARKELIKGLRDLSGGGSCKIGVKRMGELDEKPFAKACKQRFSGEEVEVQHNMLCSEWQEKLKDPSWQPFKIVGTGDNLKEVVDEEDERLRNLREEWGEEVKNAVKISLEVLNEVNSSGRYIVPVAWNYEKGREATLKEGIAHMAKQINTLKRKRT